MGRRTYAHLAAVLDAPVSMSEGEQSLGTGQLVVALVFSEREFYPGFKGSVYCCLKPTRPDLRQHRPYPLTSGSWALKSGSADSLLLHNAPRGRGDRCPGNTDHGLASRRRAKSGQCLSFIMRCPRGRLARQGQAVHASSSYVYRGVWIVRARQRPGSLTPNEFAEQATRKSPAELSSCQWGAGHK